MPPQVLELSKNEERSVWPLTVDAYHLLSEAGLIPEKSELLYGFVYHKMAKSSLLTCLVDLIKELLSAYLAAGFWLRQEQPLVAGNSVPEPDLCLVKGHRSDYTRAHPTTAELVVEVAVTSTEYDRSKGLAYARAGVKEFWLVSTEAKQVELYTQPGAEGYAQCQTFTGEELAHSAVVAGFSLEPKVLFALC